MVLQNDAADLTANQNSSPITLEGPAPALVCKLCNHEYTSTGKHDTGYCPNCLKQLLFGFYVGGPLDGQKVAAQQEN